MDRQLEHERGSIAYAVNDFQGKDGFSVDHFHREITQLKALLNEHEWHELLKLEKKVAKQVKKEASEDTLRDLLDQVNALANGEKPEKKAAEEEPAYVMAVEKPKWSKQVLKGSKEVIDYHNAWQERVEAANWKAKPRLEEIQERYSKLLSPRRFDVERVKHEERHLQELQGIIQSVQQQLRWAGLPES